MTPSWYDVLDVEPTATADEIRASWRAAVADLDPTDRRFRLLNQAAEVLLDPTRRAEHDAALAAEADVEDATPAAETAQPDRADTTPGVVETPATDDEPEPSDKDAEPGPRRTWWSPPVWVIAPVAALAAVVVVLAVLTLRSPSDSAVADDTEAAQSAAERAVTSVLAYDYRDMDASEAAATPYLTSGYREDYEQLFTLLKQNAEAVKPVVTATVLASGVERVNDAADRISVLVFVNQSRTNAQASTPEVYQNQVTMTMSKVDGDWLVDDMVTTAATE